ncbi:MAG TPA: nitrite reductase (NAD(P)H) small subunit, partial [Agitococcus sp.]|nr:nitrite reductase (NAD(P)H) small subunit [Agitococcus sp.]
TLKVSGVNLFSAGDFSGANAETIVLRDTSSSIYKRLFIKDNKLVGAVLFGDVQDGNWYFDLIKQQQDISDIRADLVFGQ